MTSNSTLEDASDLLSSLYNSSYDDEYEYGNSSYDGYGNSTKEDYYGYGYDEGGYSSSSGGDYGYGGKKEYGEDFFYGAMSVAVLTLGLVIFVEFVLHQIDHSAVGKPFYQAVLDAVYRELAVLGIVEFGVYVMQQYYEYDKDKKAVFADVHFLLFYTDIFNALQAVVQAYATQYVSDKMWVKTEELELDHYVEIREEYDRVYEQLFGVSPSADSAKDSHQHGLLSNLSHSIFQPKLNAKYNKLLLQVRFHELRVYFLQAYKLPIKLKISDYLKRSELNVMLSLVHISPVAWLWLTAICNLFYYLGGIVAEVTGEANASATFYSAAFFLAITLMVAVAFLLDKQMHSIFHRIMQAKHLWAVDTDSDSDEDNNDIHHHHEKQRLEAEQRDMFVLGDPNLVVTMIQFMQFGYAIAFSIVIIYWKDMARDDFANPHWYLWSSLICYALFVYQMARVVPRYTLCTNLGQLVDKDLIRETVAAHKLKEAERFRTQKHDDEDEHIFDFGDSDWTTASSDGSTDGDTKKDTDSDGTVPSSTEVISLSTSSATAPTTANIKTTTTTTTTTVTEVTVKDLLPAENTHLGGAAARLQERRKARKKAASEGVALMRKMKITDEIDVDALIDGTLQIDPSTGQIIDTTTQDVDALEDQAAAARQQSQRKKSTSDGVGAMRSKRKKSLSAGVDEMQIPDRETLLANLVKMDTKTAKMAVSTRNLDISTRNVDATESSSSKEFGASARRRKSNSTGVMSMTLMEDEEFDGEDARQQFAQSNRKKSNSANAAIVLMQQKGEEMEGTSGEMEGSRRRKSNSGNSSILRMRQGGEEGQDGRRKSNPSEIFNSSNAIVSYENDDDNNSIALSEVEGSPLQRVPSKEEHHHEELSFNEQMCAFFNGSLFRIASQVGGTMICFFIAAMRVEGFLQVQCIVPEDDYSWDLPLKWSFVLESAWLVTALFTTVILIFTFSGKEGEWKRHDWNTFVAGLLNLVIVTVCLALLFLAEAQRCCDGEDFDNYDKTDYYPQGEESTGMYYDSRFLAEYGYDDKKECKDLTFDCTCEPFGQRVSGGLGSLEPWTALIALQIFRFIVAKKITKALGLGEKVRHHGHDEHGHGHGHGHGPGGLPPPSAIADAWQDAVAKHPELVEKYGEFSGELLQAMLGLEIIERKEHRSTPKLLPSPKDGPKDGELKKTGLARHGEHLTLEDDRYKSLAPEAQQIIASGLAGRPVRVSRASTTGMLPQSSSSLTAPLAPLEFEIDAQRDKLEKAQLLMSSFEFPNARIIRSIRRCDKMFHPLLQEWVAVDVILTKHEIVYMGINESDNTPGSLSKTKACNQALVATKGGKGLRLCDVTDGRRIIGHLSLEDVVAVHVDREMPHENNGPKEVDVDEEAGKKIDPKECWQTGGHVDLDSTMMAGRWNEVMQDRLKVETTRGTLFLRFYSDLVDTEQHPDRDLQEVGDDAPLHKDVAFQWAQTIGHLCADQ